MCGGISKSILVAIACWLAVLQSAHSSSFASINGQVKHPIPDLDNVAIPVVGNVKPRFCKSPKLAPWFRFRGGMVCAYDNTSGSKYR